MNPILALAALADRLDPGIGALLDHFRDEHVPIELSVAIGAAAIVLLLLLIGCGLRALMRIRALQHQARACGTGAAFRKNFAALDLRLAQSLFGPSWAEYRKSLKQAETQIFYLRHPGDAIGLHGVDSRCYPARLFSAAHGYFIGVGLVLTFLGLVAALKFAAAGIASPDLAVAKEALNALLAAAAFKFMTSIAGLGSSLILSIAARSMSYMIESAAQNLARELEHAMQPIFLESLAYDQLAATRVQTQRLERIEIAMQAGVAQAAPAIDAEALRRILASVAAETRRSAGTELKQIAGQISGVGDGIGTLQRQLGQSGEQFAAQLGESASRLTAAAETLQSRVDGRIETMGARIDGFAASLARGESLIEKAAEKAAGLMLSRAGEIDKFLQSQIGTMRETVALLNGARDAIDRSAAAWAAAAAPVTASVEASRQITGEIGRIADRVGSSQREMAEMAKAIALLSERVGTVCETYRDRFEKIDGELQSVFVRLQGGTQAFGEEVMEFVGKLDASLASGMQAFSLGTEELREVMQMLMVKDDAGEKRHAA